MILLETGNKILFNALSERFERAAEGGKHDVADITFCDFDGVKFHVTSNPEARNEITISINYDCYDELMANGGDAVIEKLYAQYVTETEDGYHLSLKVDLESPPDDTEKLCTDIANLKRNLLGAPFDYVFSEMDNNNVVDMISINYRQGEVMYIKPAKEEVTVVFSIKFKDIDDVILAKVFLQEFSDARRNVHSAPAVSYSKDPPGELDGLNAPTADDIGYVTFVLFSAHLKSQNRDNTISLVQMFRDYLHYHIKCSKAYMHTRMRARVVSLLQILNRAKPEPEKKEKKTASGRTFKRG